MPVNLLRTSPPGSDRAQDFSPLQIKGQQMQEVLAGGPGLRTEVSRLPLLHHRKKKIPRICHRCLLVRPGIRIFRNRSVPPPENGPREREILKLPDPQIDAFYLTPGAQTDQADEGFPGGESASIKARTSARCSNLPVHASFQTQRSDEQRQFLHASFNNETKAPVMPARTIVIGDIHGCAREFEKLLTEVKPTSDDAVILLGDLVNRGPDTRRVVEIARQNRFRALLGNHELRLLTFNATEDPAVLKKYDHPSIDALEEPDWDYLRQMEPFIRLPDSGHLLIHGGLPPGSRPESLGADVLTNTKRISPTDVPESHRHLVRQPLHWSKVWPGPETVIYGHTPRLAIDRQHFAIGIDTGCVYGGFLTACILPDLEFVQVRAKRPYAR